MKTKYDQDISDESVRKYMNHLINRFYKILPLTEEGCETIDEYMLSLQRELLGCQGLFQALQEDDRYLSVLSLLQYFIEHNDDDYNNLRREIFQVINTLNKMKGCLKDKE